MNDEMDALIESWLEGSLDPLDEAKLNDWLQENPQHMKRFVEANLREQMLREVASGVFREGEVQQKVSLPAAQGLGSTQKFSLWRSVAVPLSLTACLFLLASMTWWVLNPAAPSLEPFVTVAAVHDVDNDLKAGDRLANQTIEFDRGMLRLLFDNGVEVTLQGPAEYQLVAPSQTRLLAGLLTTTVPLGAEGFQVSTPTAEIVDLGTAFGVELSDDGAAKVSVFDGEVEITPVRSATVQDQSVSRATEGQTILVSAQSEVEVTDLDATPFENVWPIASGIEKSTGAFEFAPPWPRPMGLIQSNSKIFVLPEGYAQTVDSPIPINVSDAGTYRKISELDDSTITAGTRVKSFLLQFRPEDLGSGRRARPAQPDPSNLKRIVGEITFDQPILGVIVRGDDLRATDGVFSKRGGQVPQKGRALELFGSPRDDVITLSEDRRSVKLDLAAFGIFSDQVRVIVAQPLHKAR